MLHASVCTGVFMVLGQVSGQWSADHSEVSSGCIREQLRLRQRSAAVESEVSCGCIRQRGCLSLKTRKATLNPTLRGKFGILADAGGQNTVFPAQFRRPRWTAGVRAGGVAFIRFLGMLGA